MADYLVELDGHFRTNRMEPAQQLRYTELLRKLRDTLPIIERRRLYCPPVLLNRESDA